jgi:AcrR family transcriptional regulator
MDIPFRGNEEPLSRRERERIRHRQEIMDAAIRVFARRGFAAATLDEIAQEAEFSKGTLYLYFPSKEDILFNILFVSGQIFQETFGTVLNGEKSYREELRDLFLNVAELSFQNKDMMRVIFSQFSSGYNAISVEAGKTLCTLHDETMGILRTRTRKAYEDGELRDVNLEAVNSIIHGSLDGMMVSRWNIESLEILTKAVDAFIDILFGGIAKERKNCA